MSVSVKKAAEAYEKAAKQLIKAVQKAYPSGSTVTVKLGRSTFSATVESHSECWWHDPGYLRGRNQGTGCLREFSYQNILPEESPRRNRRRLKASAPAVDDIDSDDLF